MQNAHFLAMGFAEEPTSGTAFFTDVALADDLTGVEDAGFFPAGKVVLLVIESLLAAVGVFEVAGLLVAAAGALAAGVFDTVAAGLTVCALAAGTLAVEVGVNVAAGLTVGFAVDAVVVFTVDESSFLATGVDVLVTAEGFAIDAGVFVEFVTFVDAFAGVAVF